MPVHPSPQPHALGASRARACPACLLADAGRHGRPRGAGRRRHRRRGGQDREHRARRRRSTEPTCRSCTGPGLVVPAFVDAHTHLDKGHIWPRAQNPNGSIMGARETVPVDREAHWSAADVRARMEFALQAAYALWHARHPHPPRLRRQADADLLAGVRRNARRLARPHRPAGLAAVRRSTSRSTTRTCAT